MKIRLRMAIATMVALITLPFMAFAQPVLLPSSSLVGDDPDGTFSAFGDAYAAAADSWKDWLFVGVPRETTFRDGSDFSDGAVYIYKKTGGTYVFSQKLTVPGSSLDIGDRFGGGIEAAGGWLFVGAANVQDFPGLVDPRQGIEFPDAFVFAGQVNVYKLKGGTWNFVQTLTAPAPKTGGSFGTRTQASHIALDSKGKVAVIGELNNFAGGVGELHTYRLKKGSWKYVQTIEAPVADLDSFGDDLVFADKKYLVAGGGDLSDDELTNQGYVFLFKAKGSSGEFEALPKQTIAGPVYPFADCPSAGINDFGAAGLDATKKIVVVADPCATGTAGALAGAVSVYRLGDGSTPLTLEQTIEGNAPNDSIGGNAFGSRHAVAVNGDGDRILIGAPLSPIGFFDETAAGADVRSYSFDDGVWTNDVNLSTFTPPAAIFRSFGDTVFFADDETAFVREGNFIDPFVSGLKGQGLLYGLPDDDDDSDD